MNTPKSYKTLDSVIREVVNDRVQANMERVRALALKGMKDPSSDPKVQVDMNREKELAKAAMERVRKGLKKKLNNSFNLNITDEQADDIIESIITDTQGE